MQRKEKKTIFQKLSIILYFQIIFLLSLPFENIYYQIIKRKK